MQWSLFRVLGALLAVYVAWALLTDFAGTLFLLCMAMAGWRLWRTAMVGPGQRRPGASRPAPPPPRRQDGDDDSPAPAVAPVSHRSRSLSHALAELDGMVGLASVKEEVRKQFSTSVLPSAVSSRSLYVATPPEEASIRRKASSCAATGGNPPRSCRSNSPV